MIYQAKNAVQFFSTGFVKFQLQNGPVVTVRKLKVGLTYEGWLEGLPGTWFNDLQLANVRESVRRSFGSEFPIHICNVPRHCITGQFDTCVGQGRYEVTSDVQTAEFLPRLEIFASCESNYDSREPDSSRGLIIVWYQDELAPVPVPRVREEIEQLDWYRLAKVFDPNP